MTVAATFCALRAVGAGISPAAAFALVPIVALFVLMPVTVQGLGVREAAYAYFFGLAGVASHDAVAAAFVSFLATLACSAIGALLLVQPAAARLLRRAPTAVSAHDAAMESRAA